MHTRRLGQSNVKPQWKEFCSMTATEMQNDCRYSKYRHGLIYFQTLKLHSTAASQKPLPYAFTIDHPFRLNFTVTVCLFAPNIQL